MPDVRSIVVGVDFTPCSANALREAMRIAAASPGAAVRAAHVIDTLVVVDAARGASPQQRAAEAALRQDAERAWTRFAASVEGAAAVPFEAHVNNRVAGILAAAAGHRADLLVLGAFGERRPDVGLGTVASACVRQSPADVLLVRDTRAAGTPGPIVCATDFSATARRAAAWAAELATIGGDALHLLHVFEPPSRRAGRVLSLGRGGPTDEATLHADAAAQLNALADELKRSRPGLAVRTCVFDRPGHRSGINTYAGDIKAGLIVLGTRGRANLRDMLLGSTAEKTLLTSQSSVLAVRPRVDDA